MRQNLVAVFHKIICIPKSTSQYSCEQLLHAWFFRQSSSNRYSLQLPHICWVFKKLSEAITFKSSYRSKCHAELLKRSNKFCNFWNSSSKYINLPNDYTFELFFESTKLSRYLNLIKNVCFSFSLLNYFVSFKFLSKSKNK